MRDVTRFCEGIATNRPFLPSMTLTLRTTKQWSNVNVAYAFSRFSGLSRNATRTSVISIRVSPQGRLAPRGASAQSRRGRLVV